jgi:alkylhydroperoxidase family enzyme
VAAVLDDYRTAPLSEKDRALFAFLDVASRDTARITREDADRLRRAGWTDEAVYDAITVCALFRFYNTWVDATGVHDMPAAAYAMSGKRMAETGYVRS